MNRDIIWVSRGIATFLGLAFHIGCGGGADTGQRGTDPSSGGSGGSSLTNGGSNTAGGNTSQGGSSATANGGTSSTAGSGGTSSTGGSSGGNSSGAGPNGGSGPFVPPECTEGSSTELPDTAPELEPGVWTHVNPATVNFAPGDAPFTQGMTIDPCNPATLYLCVVAVDKTKPVGLYRSTDAGTNWQEIGDFESPIRVRVDPADPLHLYLVDGVAGDTNGFWVSTDGGESWYRPQSFQDIASNGLIWDAYHVEPDPADFNHVLVTFHNPWQGAEYGGASGVIESTDGGDTWIVHAPESSWYSGHDVFFLHNPSLGIGNSQTWLLGTQGDGYWRTTNAGGDWTKVSEVNMDHGGGSTYYTADGTLYVSGTPQIIRSTNNGETFTQIGPSTGYYLSVIGDGNFLYTHGHSTEGPFHFAPEDDDTNWSVFKAGQNLNSGTFELALDTSNRILYSANLGEGIIALKLEE